MASSTDPWKTAFISLLVVSIGGGIFFAFLSTPSPILYLNPPFSPSDHCLLNGFAIGGEYELHLSNKAETPAVSQLCFSGNNISFKEGEINYQDKICYSERTINPKSSDLVQVYAPLISSNNTKDNANFSIKVTASCKYNILSIIPRNCPGLEYTCKYQKSGNYYKLLSD